MIDEADPSTRVLEEHVQPLLERLPFLMMEHVFSLECLIDGQIDRIVRIRHAGLVQTRRFNFGRVHITVHNIVFALFPTVLPLHRRWHPLVVRLAESRRTKTPEEGETTPGRRRFVHLTAVVLCVLRFATRRLQGRVLRLETLLGHQLVLAALKSSVSGRGARSFLREPRALVLASWKTLVVLTWAFPGYCRLVLGSKHHVFLRTSLSDRATILRL